MEPPIFVKNVKQWYISDISEAIETCIILDNIMVEEHLGPDDQEQHN